MKKLIFLLILAVLLVGFMPAQDAARPPGALALDVAMSGYGIHEAVISPDTVLVDALRTALSSEILAYTAFYMIDVSAVRPHYCPMIKPIVAGQGVFIPSNMATFHLRL